MTPLTDYDRMWCDLEAIRSTSTANLCHWAVFVAARESEVAA